MSVHGFLEQVPTGQQLVLQEEVDLSAGYLVRCTQGVYLLRPYFTGHSIIVSCIHLELFDRSFFHVLGSLYIDEKCCTHEIFPEGI